MKVKDLVFVNGEAGLSFVNPLFTSSFMYLLVERRSSRSFYVFAKKYNHDFPCACYRVSGNMDVNSLVDEIIANS